MIRSSTILTVSIPVVLSVGVFVTLNMAGVLPDANFDQLLFMDDLSRSVVTVDGVHPTDDGHLHVTFLGTSSFLIQDDQGMVMSDGFFTRNAGGRIGGLQMALMFVNPFVEVASNETAIRTYLERLGVSMVEVVTSMDGPVASMDDPVASPNRHSRKPLHALAVVHSHHDHAMDSGLVAKFTGASLVGSNSTANIARGNALPESQMDVVKCVTSRSDLRAFEGPSVELSKKRYGQFDVTMLPAIHLEYPLPILGDMILNSTIDEVLLPPTHLRGYKEGCSYSVLVEHVVSGVKILIHGSANALPGALVGVSADIVLLSIAGMASNGPEYLDRYWKHVVEQVGAKYIVPCHWDDFAVPLDEDVVVGNRRDFDAGMAYLKQQERMTGVQTIWMPVGSRLDVSKLLHLL